MTFPPRRPRPWFALALIAAILAVALATNGRAVADPAKFDLAGPALEVQVTRAGATLPIARVPSLAAGDLLSIRADMPPGQSARYLMVAAFLRGATNPPPRAWFAQSETWKSGAREGLELTVPQGAQQLLVFLAPDRPGGYKTLMAAVRGRPGAFVRASQDLTQASLDRSRLEAFLAAIGRADPADPERLKTVSALLARSLVIKLNADCFQKAADLRAACLTQGGDSLVLNDGHGASIVETLTSGNPAELVQQIAATPQARAGYYSPYVGALLDFARILDGLRTPTFQYVPALVEARGVRLSLILNTAPSFHDPVSVLVAALPPVAVAPPPPLAPVDPKAVWCLRDPALVLPVDGAPLVFSTAYLHDITLHLVGDGGEALDLPAIADPERGGFVIDPARPLPKSAALLHGSLHGVIRGLWGFAPYEGPRFSLRSTSTPADWRVPDEDRQSLIVGRDDTLHLLGDEAPCVESVTLSAPPGEARKVEWKADAAGAIAIVAPLAKAAPGPVVLRVKLHGQADPAEIALKAFAQAGRLDAFVFHAGDRSGVLKGSRLDEVEALTLAGVRFLPGALTTVDGADELALVAAPADPQDGASALAAGRTISAQVVLKDGRTVVLPVVVAPARPSVSLIAVEARPRGDPPALHIDLAGRDDLPWESRVTFSLRVEAPTSLNARDRVEVAAPDAGFSVTLGPSAGLVLEDAQVAVATLDPAVAFGPSAFGALRFRLIHDGVASDWRPLGVLVRLPDLTALKCPAAADRPCALSGANLFLIDSVSRTADPDKATRIPEGFPGAATPVPHPAGGRLYVRLRDDPSALNVLVIPPRSR